MNIPESLKKLSTPIVIIGLGKSGRSAEKFLLKIGFTKKDVLTFDEKSEADLKNWTDFENLKKGSLVVSPGVPLNSENIQKLKNLGWLITSEMSLASQILTSEVVIGITGSVGKSTVTSFLGAGAVIEDSRAFVGGNLGTPFCDYALSVLDNKNRVRFVILELSSYQLENCDDLKLDYSAITYLSANHLERYASLDEYYLTKCHIGKMTKNVCVLNSASKDLMSYSKNISGAQLVTQIQNQKIQLIGKHNLENYFIAAAIARECRWSEKSIQAMQNFSGLAHRLETVGVFNQILYINDSKATAMDSVLVAAKAALEKVVTENHLHLLLGGKDKNLPWRDLNSLSKIKNIKFYFFGQCAQIAKMKSNLSGSIYLKMSDALDETFKQAKPGDVVLLSPGGTSLDEFKNFEDRGNQFKEIIQKNYSVK